VVGGDRAHRNRGFPVWILAVHLLLPRGTNRAGLASDRIAEPAHSGHHTIILLASSAAFWAGERGIRQGGARSSIFGFIAAIALGSAFVAVQLLEWKNKTFSINSDLYGSLYFTITGFHLCHVIIGLGVLLLLLAWTMMGYFDHKRHVAVTIGGVYWHFVDVVWLFVFSALYLSPYLQHG